MVTLYVPFLSLIGQNLTGEFMKKIYAACGNLFTVSWSWQSFVSSYDVLNHWMYKMKYSCYQDSSVIHGWFVYWVFGWEMRLLSKISEIRFRKASFPKMSLIYLTLLDAWEGWKDSNDCCLIWWHSGAASRLVSISNYCSWCFFFSVIMKSSVVYAANLCAFVSSDLT